MRWNFRIHYKKLICGPIGGMIGIFIMVFMPLLVYGALNDATCFQLAKQFLKNARYLDALNTYRQINDSSKDPNHRALALLYIANIYSLYLDQKLIALNYYDKVIQEYPNTEAASESIYYSAVISYENGKYNKAFELFSTYLSNYPNGRHRYSAEVWSENAKHYTKTSTSIPESTPKSKPLFLQKSNNAIRILLKKNANQIVLKSQAPLQVSHLSSKKTIPVHSRHLIFTYKHTQLFVNGHATGTSACKVMPEKNQLIEIDNLRYRGYMAIIIGDGSENQFSRMGCINYISVEDYLYGVVPKEMPSNWEVEALKAQAIASRTYALYIKSKMADKLFDMEASISDQVYGGFLVETSQSNLAVDATRGKVMTYDGQLIIAPFHSNSGGYTENAENVWQVEMPHLKGLTDQYSLWGPKLSWEQYLSYEDIQTKLKQAGIYVGKIKQIAFKDKTPSGRYKAIHIISNTGTTVLSSNNFRIKIGPDVIKSTLFELISQPRGIYCKGRGYGHGVGMSQWGAYGMAKSGYACTTILKHYYKGIDIALSQ
ncbi:MAG: SpoIID/LytB domain-containing protein [Desulfobacterales bacterium]|nr:SpoIID/LytB domain-containing protein [Desulfobacterales bacterium]